MLGVEHVALPHLACCVDVAMCQFRKDVASLLSSSDALCESVDLILAKSAWAVVARD